MMMCCTRAVKITPRPDNSAHGLLADQEEVRVSSRLLHQHFSVGQCPSLAEPINLEGTSITAASCHIDQLISWT